MEQNLFKSGKTLAQATGVLLLLTAIFSGVFAFLKIIEYFFFYPPSNVAENNGSYLAFSLLLIFSSLCFVLISYATPVVFLIWQYRAAKNLRFFNEGAVSNSPGWNVGWWFIPFASLVMPFQCINELLNGSRPENALDESYTADSSARQISGWWWGIYLISGTIGMITAYLSFRLLKDISLMPYYIVSMIFSHSFSIMAALLVRKIVLSINSLQEESYRLAEEKRDLLHPPPPPLFS
jgi:Domain of unknown function (DUF4328)